MQNKPATANQFPKVYEALGIDLGLLGCLMLDIEAPTIELPQEFKDGLYKTQSPTRFWIDGYTWEKVPHMTLFYGFMRPATEWETQIRDLLEGTKLSDPDTEHTVKVKSVGFFNSPYPDDEYFCLVAHLEPSEDMLEARQRMELLPHINTYPEFKPHVTIAYIKKDEVLRNSMIRFFHAKLKGRTLRVTGLNFGGNH